MRYKKWILSRVDIKKDWEEHNFSFPKEITDMKVSELKEKLSEIYMAIMINFSDELSSEEGIETKAIRNFLYKYAQNRFYTETEGVDEVINIFGKINVFNLFNKDKKEQYAKSVD
jgi:SUMO ligase MMS21 Smc5/6 complex component